MALRSTGCLHEIPGSHSLDISLENRFVTDYIAQWGFILYCVHRDLSVHLIRKMFDTSRNVATPRTKFLSAVIPARCATVQDSLPPFLYLSVNLGMGIVKNSSSIMYFNRIIKSSIRDLKTEITEFPQLARYTFYLG